MRTDIVATEALETAGCVSYWRLSSDVSLEQLAKHWGAAGLAANFLPARVKDEVALGRAVADMAEKRILVRPLARRGAWAIVQETVLDQGEGFPAKLLHNVIVHVFFRQGSPVIVQATGTFAEFQAYHDKIHQAYNRQRNSLAHNDISSWLLGMIQLRGSVSLRESGGVYFIPKNAIDFWNKVSDVVEKAGAGYIFRIPAMKTAEAVAAITDAITAEAAQIAQKMEEELMATGDDALGQRALKTRAKEVEVLAAKLQSYEELLGRQLEIQGRVKELRANLAAAALMASVEEKAA